MSLSPDVGAQLSSLAAHLAGRRPVILKNWRKRVDADPDLTTANALPRSQFNDHIPGVLDALQKTLRAGPRDSDAAEEKRQREAAGHGLQRWQQGYRLREVTREWGHLEICLVEEVEAYAKRQADFSVPAMAAAWRAVTDLCSLGISDSTAQYFLLQQTEAEGHVRDLQATIEEARGVERRRTELFQQAAHDLRGKVGVVKNVTASLGLVPEARRDEFTQMLERSVSSLHTMLDGVLDLARLQAGRELLEIKPFDAAEVLRGLAENFGPLAAERGLYLRIEGPDDLQVEGDPVKVSRVAQNLLLNALKYTRAGGVTISWGDSRDNDAKRWMLCVQDTGPGIHAGPGAPLATALQDATAEARQVDKNALHHEREPAPHELGSPGEKKPDLRAVSQARGEGIGLSIVKRLCELLDATLELESTAEVGTTFRIVFPRHYEPVAPGGA